MSFQKSRLFLVVLVSSLLSILIIPGAVNAQINFEHGTWSEIKAKAKAENKLIFVDAYTTWCGPCKWMAKNVFTNDTVAAYYNSTFVNAKIDMEAGEGKDLAVLYKVRAYPSLLFVDANGDLVHKAVGSAPAADFVQLGKDALVPEKQFGTLERKYKSGQRDLPFIKTYLAALSELHQSTSEPLAGYLQTQQDEALSSPENWFLIHAYLTDPQSKSFIYLVKHPEAFVKRYSADTVNAKIYSVYVTECYRLIFSRKADSVDYLPLKEKIQQSGFARKEELLLEADLAYYDKRHDSKSYAHTATVYIDKYKGNDPNVLNNCSYFFYENVKDKVLLSRAEQWAKKGYTLDPNPSTSMDTYACLLSVNGKKEEAIKLETAAIAQIKAAPDKYDQSGIGDMEKKIASWSNK